MIRIYLDHNASTPVDPRVLDTLISYLKNDLGNPSSAHFHGKEARHVMTSYRSIIARFFGFKPQELIFNSGGTEGAAFFIHGILSRHPNAHVITSNAEHSAVYQNLREWEKKGTMVSYLPVGEWGAVRPEQVKEAISSQTKLIMIMAVNNETGVLTDIPGIAAVAEKAGVPLIVDGVAWIGKEMITIPKGVSGVFFSGHKIHALKGIGWCLCRQSLKLLPLYYGGEQEMNRRPGTENLPGIISVGKAIEILNEEQSLSILKVKELRDRLEEGILSRLNDVKINGAGPRVCNTTNLAFLGCDGESLLMHFDLEGLSVSHGSACSSGSLEPSRVLSEMFSTSRVRSSIRFSLARTTTIEEIDRAIEIIVSVVTKLRQFKGA